MKKVVADCFDIIAKRRDQADTDRIPLRGTPGYNTLTVRGSRQISERLKLALSLENLFDADYRIHGSALNEPGRNFVISVFWTNQALLGMNVKRWIR